MKELITIVTDRLEVNFLHRSFQAERDKRAQKILEKEDTELRVEMDNLSKLVLQTEDLMREGDSNRLRLLNLRKDLEDALIFCEEPNAVIEARKRLDNLPKDEEYRLTFDRSTAKFVMQLLEAEIHWLRYKNIPTIQARDASKFTDVIETKTYYINKAKRAATILEGMKVKIEKEL